MSYVRLLIHAVWATKDRKPFLNKENREAIKEHIKDYAKSKGIHLINVNGYVEHLHCLISLDAQQNIATIINLIKGESSNWAGKNLTLPEKIRMAR